MFCSKLTVPLAVMIFVCACTQPNESLQTSRQTESVPIIEYLEQVHKLHIDSGELYGVIYYSRDCRNCNPLMDSFFQLLFEKAGSKARVCIIKSAKDNMPDEYDTNGAILLTDYNGYLAQYGLLFSKHTYFKIFNRKVTECYGIDAKSISRGG